MKVFAKVKVDRSIAKSITTVIPMLMAVLEPCRSFKKALQITLNEKTDFPMTLPDFL